MIRRLETGEEGEKEEEEVKGLQEERWWRCSLESTHSLSVLGTDATHTHSVTLTCKYSGKKVK